MDTGTDKFNYSRTGDKFLLYFVVFGYKKSCSDLERNFLPNPDRQKLQVGKIWIHEKVKIIEIIINHRIINDRMEKLFKGGRYVYNLLYRGECARISLETGD